ncbi:transposase [Escherichia coli]|nr:transposase [Escherichia coli]EHS0448729.1 transposase [Escherichia coli]
MRGAGFRNLALGEPVGGAYGTATGVSADQREKTHATWREVVGQPEKSNPAVTEMMVEAHVLVCFSFPKAHQVNIHSTNTPGRLNKEVKRHVGVVHLPQRREYHAASASCSDGTERGVDAAEPLSATTHDGGDRPCR